MKYKSTRGGGSVNLDRALVAGIAPDGGLYMPETNPTYTVDDFAGSANITETAKTFLTPYFQDSTLGQDLDSIIAETFRFPIPVMPMQVAVGRCEMLELYHGPTAAFKDVGAGFLAACLSRLEGDPANPLTILVATSGDTGGAVAAAFDGRLGMRVVVLYPDGMVSGRQAQQLTCWGDNVLSLAIEGTFDDCQSLVKKAMANQTLTAKYRFSSANSINIGRLLPQAIYYAHASVQHWSRTGRAPGFVIPTGNLGNAFACFLCKELGLPIGDLVLATNANRTICDYLAGNPWQPRASIQTLASAMDVGNPSNMERLRYLGGEARDLAAKVRAVSVSDAQIKQQIHDDFDELGLINCPHTATATFAWNSLSEEEKQTQDWIVVATAHAAKFEQSVEPVIGRTIELPEGLANIMERSSTFVNIAPSLDAFASALDGQFNI